MIFKEIGINFHAQHEGQSHLCLAAEDISRRLMTSSKFKSSTTPDLPSSKGESSRNQFVSAGKQRTNDLVVNLATADEADSPRSSISSGGWVTMAI
mmetsp:Transcript_52073/g.96428  ORF Transcript_52073/g.96428 Transcript_52073/m.96428 type:complete len:96 (+) Transcript_52073:1-288(+)